MRLENREGMYLWILEKSMPRVGGIGSSVWPQDLHAALNPILSATFSCLEFLCSATRVSVQGYTVRYLGTWLMLMLLCFSQLSSIYNHKITFWSQCRNGWWSGICWRAYLVCVSECRSNQYIFFFSFFAAGSLVPQRRCVDPGFSNTQLGK